MVNDHRRAADYHLVMSEIERNKKMNEIEQEQITEYLERLKKAAVELEKVKANFNNEQDKIRLAGKIEGVTLAIRYFEEMFKV